MFGYFWELGLSRQTEDGIFEATLLLALPPPPSLNVERDVCQLIATPVPLKSSTLEVGVEGGGSRKA